MESLAHVIVGESAQTIGPIYGHPLNSIEWHDLPVQKLSISKNGIEVQVMPFNEDMQENDYVTLLLDGAKSMHFDFDIQGANTLNDLDSLEVHSFDYVQGADASISGKLVFLLGWPASVWVIKFTNATWRLMS